MQHRTKKAHKLFLKEYLETHGNISKSCDAAGVDRATYYLWIEKYPEFKQECEEILERWYDSVEDKIHNFVDRSNPDMLKFYAKTKLKKRGYVEKQELEHQGSDDKPMKINVIMPEGVGKE